MYFLLTKSRNYLTTNVSYKKLFFTKKQCIGTVITNIPICIILNYSKANCVSARAERTYAERYPNRMHPDRKTFERLDQRIRNSDCLISKLTLVVNIK